MASQTQWKEAIRCHLTQIEVGIVELVTPDLLSLGLNRNNQGTSVCT